MNNKKLVITMVSTICILLVITTVIQILNIANIDIINAIKIGKSSNVPEISVISEDENSITIAEKRLVGKEVDTEEIKNYLDSSNDRLTSVLVSRSNIDRSVYVNLEEQVVQEDYEELKTYIPIEQVKISFDMDVSKPTGLSREDFIALVNRMKVDRTGILKANAGVIWDCCQRYSVNEIFILGICGIESAWCSAGQHQRTHNYASLMSGGKLIPYSSDAEGFEAMIKLLGQRYLRPGGGLYHGSTITGVGTSYCNRTTWPPKVYKCMQQVFQ